MKFDKKSLLNILKIVWVVAVVAGGIYYVVKNYALAIQYLSTINPIKLLICFLLIVVVRLLNVDLVQRSLFLVGWKPNFKLAFNFVSISQLGKYIPGGVWQFVARFTAYKENQISYKNMGKSFIVENLWMVIGSFLVSVFFLGISHPTEILVRYGIHLSNTALLLIAIACLVIFFVTLIIIEYVVKTETRKPNLKNVIFQFISQTVLWIVLGLSFFSLFSQTGTLNDLFFTIGAFGLSFMVGYVAIFAPGGIGVREYIAVVLFSLMFSSVEIGIYTIVHRLIYTIVEFLLAGLAYLLSRKNKTAQPEPVTSE